MKKISLNRQQRFLAWGAGIVLASLGLLFWIYLPLSSRLKKEGGELSRLHSELKVARETAESAKGTNRPLRLPRQKELSSVIEEVTDLGKDFGIDFRSIHPQQAQETPSGYQFLLIEMKLESSYRDLGLFVGSLRTLERGVVTVESFEIDREEEISTKLNCRLLIKMVLHP